MVMTVDDKSLKKDIRAALNEAGVSRVDKDILGRCVALASTLQLSPEAMATCWEAFSLTNKVSELTSYTFDAYKTQLHKHSEIASPLMTGKGAIQSRNAKRQFSTHMVTPPTTKRHQTHNNKESTFSFVSVAIQATNVPLSTPEDEAAAIPVVKYDERTKAGQVAASFNPKEWPAISFKLPGTKHRCVIDSQDFSYGANITENYRHMFTVSEDRAYALEKHLRRVGKEIIDKYGIGNGENGVAPLEQLIVPRQDAVCCIGRICNEAHEGKLNSTSIVLEGSSATCGGARINVDLSHLKSSKQPYSLFPGQIVGIEGMNPSGRKLLAHRIFDGASHPPNTSSIGELRAFHYDKQEGAPIKVMSASGPFTTDDSMDYQPFVDFLHVVLEQSPDVVILMGPFVDMRQNKVKSGKTVINWEDDDGNVIETLVPYEAVFAQKISRLIEDTFFVDDSLKTQFVLVPSLDDATAKWVYPQPPLQDRYPRPVVLDIPVPFDIGTLGIAHINNGQQLPRVHCFSNPCTFKVNEITFGVTSTDVLFHMSAEESNSNLEPGTRLRRIAEHMMQQRSYYPLFPPPLSFPMNLDLNRMESWYMPCTPDVLILPSRLTPFANSVLEGTVVINPGHLTRGKTGGTYGIMEIHPIDRGSCDELVSEDVRLHVGLPDRINVEIKWI